MKTITIKVKDKASEMTKAELIDHLEHNLIGMLGTIEMDHDKAPSAEEKLDDIQGTLTELLNLVQD